MRDGIIFSSLEPKASRFDTSVGVDRDKSMNHKGMQRASPGHAARAIDLNRLAHALRLCCTPPYPGRKATMTGSPTYSGTFGIACRAGAAGQKTIANRKGRATTRYKIRDRLSW